MSINWWYGDLLNTVICFWKIYITCCQLTIRIQINESPNPPKMQWKLYDRSSQETHRAFQRALLPVGNETHGRISYLPNANVKTIVYFLQNQINITTLSIQKSKCKILDQGNCGSWRVGTIHCSGSYLRSNVYHRWASSKVSSYQVCSSARYRWFFYFFFQKFASHPCHIQMLVHMATILHVYHFEVGNTVQKIYDLIYRDPT